MMMPRFSYPGQRRPTRKPDLAPGFTTESADRAWEGLPPSRSEAASSTVEALVFELRNYGIRQLKKDDTKRRLFELSDKQLKEVTGRLEKLRPRYPQIDDALISFLREQVQ